MRLGLYAGRRSSFWLTGPLAQAACKRGHDVVMLADAITPKPGDTWSEIDLARDLPQTSWMRLQEFEGDWFAGPPAAQNLTPAQIDGLAEREVKIASLDPWWDSLARPFGDAYDLTQRTLRHGFLPTDGLRDVPAGEPCDIIWYAPKTLIPGYAQRAVRWVMTLILARSLRRTADRTRKRLVVKTRTKIALPHSVSQLADRVVAEPSLYPHASLSVLGTAALTVSHQSAAAAESVAADVRVLSIDLPQRHLHGYAHWQFMAARHGSPFAWPGVIESMPLIPALRWLAEWHGESPCDADARSAYIDTWLGGRVIGTSEWVLDEMERRV